MKGGVVRFLNGARDRFHIGGALHRMTGSGTQSHTNMIVLRELLCFQNVSEQIRFRFVANQMRILFSAMVVKLVRFVVIVVLDQ
jgi:hypothetical protein